MNTEKTARPGSSVMTALTWAAAGACITFVVLMDPLDLHPFDQWIHSVLGRNFDPSAEAPVQQTWTCPMHAEIISEASGTCPICLMDLVPVNQHLGHDDRVGDPDDRSIRIDPSVVQNMNVTTVAVNRRDLVRRIRTVGHLDYDQEGMVTVTTRVSGFVEKVHVDYVGQEVQAGDPLFDVYSPEVVQTQQELLSALSYRRSLSVASPEVQIRAEKLVEAARTRLGLWEIPEDEVRAVESSGGVKRSFTVAAPISGVVMERVHGLDGMAVRPGMELMHIVDLSTLWLTVEVYEDQLPWLGVGAAAEVSFDALPGESLRGLVRLIEPEVSPQTRTVRLTLEVPNQRRSLRVGMYATVVFEPVAARAALTVPTQSVIRTGERDVVVLAVGEGRFEPREVGLGVESDGVVQVLEGLDDQDVVVTSSHFLIDSESNLQAAINKMVSNRSGHEH